MVEAPALRGVVVAEEHEACMISFWGVAEKIEECIIVEEEVLWVARLGADNVGALDGVAAKEYGSHGQQSLFAGVIVTHKVFSLTLERKLAF